MRLVLALLVACAEPSPEIYDCTAVASCDGQDDTQRFSACFDRQEADDAVRSWINVCGNVAGIYGCGTWTCAETCHPTGVACQP